MSTGRGGGDGDPAVSVVIPTRDRWPLLATTLASALGQDGVALEVVVVDDGSATAAPAAAPFDDPRVRIVRNDRSLGVAGARNRGIEAARGEWIAFLDDDDVWAPAKLRRQLDAAAAARASFAYAGVILVTADRGLVTIADPPAPDRLPQLLAAYNAIPAGASNVVVATDLAREVGGFDPSFGHLADWDLWVRLAAAAPAAACDEPLVGYRLHPQSMRSTAGGAFAELARFDRMHGRPGPPAAGADLVLPLARRRPAPRRADARPGGDEPPRCPALPQPRRRDPGGPDPAPPGRGRVERTAAGPGRRRRRVAATADAGGDAPWQPRHRATADRQAAVAAVGCDRARSGAAA